MTAQPDTVQRSREERFRWDEENHLTALSQNGYVSNYWYDANGDRVIKEHGSNQAIYVNSALNGCVTQTGRYTVYPNAYYSYGDDGRYTKHIYIGSERVLSQVGGVYGEPRLLDVAGHDVRIKVDYPQIRTSQDSAMEAAYTHFDLPYNGTDHDDFGRYPFDLPGYWNGSLQTPRDSEEDEEESHPTRTQELLYYYHTDHLGSSTLVTDGNGKACQQVEYLPYGEVFLERQNGDYATPYKFNGKELDDETGLYYYGARYMSPRLSIWYGCDPLQEKYPNISSYAYCAGNPVILFDYNGEEPDEIEAARMSDFVYGKGDVKLIGGWQPSTITFGDVLLNEDESGFKSMIFERTTNGKTEYAYAFAGTDITSGKDWRNNLQQIYGNSRQYRLAIQNAVNLKKDLQGAELTFVGHSLGGGLAAASAYATGGRALTFNAAGVSPNTIKPNRLAKIDAYINYRDELNILQFGTTVAPKVNGHIHVRYGDAAILGHDIKNFYKPPIHKQLYDSAQDKVMRVINKLGDALIPKNPTLF